MRRFELSVENYKQLIIADPDIDNAMVADMVQRYANDRHRYKKSMQKAKLEAPIKAARKSMLEKYGYVDEAHIQAKVRRGPDFNPFTEDPNCKNCKKKKRK